MSFLQSDVKKTLIQKEKSIREVRHLLILL